MLTYGLQQKLKSCVDSLATTHKVLQNNSKIVGLLHINSYYNAHNNSTGNLLIENNAQ